MRWPRLKFRLQLKKHCLEFEILHQSPVIVNNADLNGYIHFEASNGWSVHSCNCPEIRVRTGDPTDGRAIFLRGDEKDKNNLLVIVFDDVALRTKSVTIQTEGMLVRNKKRQRWECAGSDIPLIAVKAAVIQALIEFATSWEGWPNEYKGQLQVKKDIYIL